jgi:hypothetical protein
MSYLLGAPMISAGCHVAVSHKVGKLQLVLGEYLMSV